MSDALVALPVIVPLLAAGLSLVLVRRPSLQRMVSIIALVAVAAVAAVLVVRADQDGPQALWIGGWPEPLGIALVADRLSSLMLLVSALVTLAVLVYSVGQGMVDEAESAPLSIYHPSFLVLAAGVANAFLAADLFNLFVSFEMLLFASYVLLTLGGTESRIRAGTIYVVVNVLSSMVFLVAIAMVYSATGSLNFAQLAGRLDALPEAVALLLQLMLLTVFSIKAAVFPLSFWLPDSYPTAPAPVTAVFAGLLTKVGVYAILRTQTLLFPDSPLTTALLVAALLTMLVGILGAVAQSDIKRMLSFTLVSHIGYMIFGVGLATAAGVSGAIFYVVHHITIQTGLFLVVGLVEHRAGSTSLLRLGGLARLSPILGLSFFVPAMNLAGIPPMSGFLGKVGLASAGIEQGSTLAYVLVAAGMATSLLTLYAVAKAWSLAFWRTPQQAHETSLAVQQDYQDAPGEERQRVRVGSASYGRVEQQEARSIHDDTPDRDLYQRLQDDDLPHHRPRTMTAAALGLVGLSLLLTVVAGPLFDYTDRAAVDLLERTPYLEAVLTGDTP
ncbi:Na+/H+ antiporter subunit D [Nocardioides caldifontis]|uniref:Na+/H+ antiporter subunit D n=1 Tax=Nocardioides caldifontis TaxID=2588938 RepID=UPI0011DFA5F6|nr:Na+/H+ antiporter subunit D [Nocardioides caldifontis]